LKGIAVGKHVIPLWLIGLLLLSGIGGTLGYYIFQTLTIPVEVKEPLEILQYPSQLSLYAGERIDFNVTVKNSASVNYSVIFDFKLNNSTYQNNYVTFSDELYLVTPGQQNLTAWLTVKPDAPPTNVILTIEFKRGFPVLFYDDFNGDSLSSDWNYVHIAAGGNISVSSSLLHIVASPLFQDEPMSAMVMRHWLTQIGDALNISVRLRVNAFDRFALQVDHGKVEAYDDQVPMFGLVFRSAGTPTSAYIVAVGAGHGEWGGGPEIEGSLYSNLQISQWYTGEIFIQKTPYLVTFSVKNDDGTIIAQQQINGSDLTAFTFNDIGSIGFNAWTSQVSGPYGNVDIDSIQITKSA